ncbi:MAG: 30S ribosomal protein S3ae [Candidatus Diapherotrites archaeon]|nr:30S ribosomal protein S3ae [Candidatus Micrarchaeota archaeon]MBU1939975.1 30S ribosomal protein S3ae [Candidatus Micrarchaeota archaeon]
MAEAKKGKERAAKRAVDKWKKKVWYTMFAPAEFDRKVLGETVASKPELLEGRIINASVRDLGGDPKKAHVKLVFKINDIKGDKAYTEVVGHLIGAGYLRRFTRRRMSKIEIVQDALTKDGKKARVKVICLTARKAERAKERAISKMLREQMAAFIKGVNSVKLVDELVFGNVSMKIFNEVKKIAPIKRIEVAKSRIVKE